MANDKKFIVKNGLQSENNVLIGKSIDDAVNKLQVEGTSKLTSSGSSVPITIENTGGINTPLMNFEGGVGALQVKNSGSGDYSILNTSGANEIKFNDNTANGLVFIAGNNDQLKINTTVADFTNVPSVGGVPVWYAGNDGAGSGLDADLLDGVNSLQFLRSDQDDTFDGNLIVTGDLTVSGTTTTINTEEILLADNIIVINSNYTGSAPSENGGIEVERGTLVNSSLLWDETSDYWKLVSAGTDLGRIITTADEGSGNGFDADTVDGIQASQFLRSDVNDTATGNLELEGTVKIGNNAGSALLTMDGAGNNRVLASTAGVIGFLDGAFAYRTYSTATGVWVVENDTQAKRFVDFDNNAYYGDFAGTSVVNQISIDDYIIHNGDANTYIGFASNDQFNIFTNGVERVTVTDTATTSSNDIKAPRFVDSGNNAYLGDFAGTSVMNTIGIDSDLFHNGDTNTKLSFGTDTVALETGGVARLTATDTAVTASVNFVGPKFVDSANAGYFTLPSGTSVLNNLGIDDDLFHNGDTNTKLSFATDTITFSTGGTVRATLNNTTATFAQNVIAPGVGIDADLFHNGDTNTKLSFGTDTISLQTAGFPIVLINNTNVESTREFLGTNIGINADLFHRGDTNTKLAFATDTISLQTGGVARLTATDTAVTASVDIIGPNVGIDADLFHNGDTNTKLSFGTDAISLQTGGVARVDISDTVVSSSVPFRSPIYYAPTGTTSFLDLDATTTSLAVAGQVAIGNVGDLVRSNDITGNGGITISPYGTVAATSNPNLSISGGNGGLPLTTLNKIDLGNNPYTVNNVLVQYNIDGVVASTLRGDGFGNMYQVIDNNQIWSVTDSSANFLLSVDASTSDVIIGDQTVTYAVMDATPVVGTATNNALHVNGSVALTSLDDAFVVGNGTATFLKGDELGFGSGGGFYMDDTATVKVRGNKAVSTSGDITGARFIDAGNATYLVDPAGTSVINDISLVGQIIHNGDTNTYLNFSGADAFEVVTGGAQRLAVTTTAVTATNSMNAPIFADSVNTAYTWNPNTSGSHRFTTPTGWLEIGSQTAGLSEFITDRAGYSFDKPIGVAGSVTATGATSTATFAQFIDLNDTGYYGDFAATSVMNRIDIDDYIRHNGDLTTYMGFSAADTFKVVTGNFERLNIDNNSADFTVNVFAPQFVDSGNVAYYGDFAGTSITNIMRANQFQVDGGSITIDSPTGSYGSIMVNGDKAGYAGYAISNDWAFISDGATNMGLYNDTDNEWVLYATRNNSTVLYSNGIAQLSAENGYAYANSSMRAPFFSDYNDTSFYADLAGQSRLKSVKAGDSAIFNSTTYPLEVKSTQERMIVIQNTSADPNFPSIFHNTRNSRSAMGISFNSVGERFWFEENGNFQAFGAGIFGSLALNGGNEDVGLLKTYGSGLADMKMFDATDYWDKRVIQPMQGAENEATTVTAEFVKNGNGPFASAYALRTSAYRTFDSDYIPVEPGEEIYVEQAVRLISGSGGLFYVGVRRYDKDKNPIASNDGITYFGASAVNVTSTSWTEYKGYHTVPTTHTPYNGSDGLGVKYVRLIVLMNYNAGGAVREFGPPILKRSDVQGKIKAQDMYIVNDGIIGNDLDVTGDITGSTITGTNVDATNFRDASNSTYSFNPRTGGKVAGTWDWTNGTIDNLNNLTFNDPGPNEGIRWKGGNEWAIFESPDDLTTNSLGNLQFTSDNLGVAGYAAVSRATITTSGDVVAARYMDAQRFRDSSDTSYYADPAGSSVLNQLYVNEYIRHSGDTDTYIRFIGADDMQLVSGGRQMLRMAEGTDPDRLRFVTDSDWTDANGDWNMSRNVSVTGTHTVLNGAYANIFYDNDDNTYYGDFGGTSIMNTVRANRFEMGSASTYIDNVSGTYGTISVTGNTGGYAGYAINDDWVFMSSGAGVAGIYNDTNNQWATIYRQAGDTELMWAGGEQASTKDGFFLGTNQLRSPIWYDSDNTAYKIDGNGTSRLLTLQVDNVIEGNINGYAETLLRKDNRIIEPNADTAGRLTFGFTSWDNNNTAPYADYLHLRSYTDAGGGSDNLLMFKKSGRGMRLWQQTWNSGTAYAAYSDLAIYNANPGGGASSNFYAASFIDADDTSFFVNPAGISKIKHLEVAGENLNASYSHAAIEVREYNYGGAQTDNDATAPRIGFHWGGRVASQIRLASNSEIQIRNNPGTGYENFRADIVYGQAGVHSPYFVDMDNTARYVDPASTSVVNIIDAKGEIYNDGWFRNDTNEKGLFSTPNNMYFASSSNQNWVARSDSTATRIDMHTSSNTRRGSFYANNSDEIGILSQDQGWALQTTNGKVDSHHNFYAPIMYDRDDTNFFVNPAGDSLFSGDVRASRFIFKDAVSGDNTFGLYFATNESAAYGIYRESGAWSNPYPDLRIAFHTGISMGAYHGYNGIRFFNDYNMATQVMSINNGSDPLGQNDVYVNNSLQAGGSLRAPIFYDSNDTGRYTDPASTSQMGTIEWDQLNARDMGDFITLYGNNNADHSISSRNASGSAADDIRINSYGSIFFNLDSNNNNTSAADFYVGRHGSATGTINNTDLFRVYGDANYAYSAFSFRAPIFFDSDDTNYFLDPSGVSTLGTSVRASEVYARNWFRNDDAAEGIYNQATGAHAYSYQAQYYAITGNSSTSAMSLQLRSHYNGTMCRWMYGDRTNSGELNEVGQWQLQTRHTDGYSPSIKFREEGNETWTGNPGNDVGKVEYHANRMYIVSGANSALVCQFRKDGTDVAHVDNSGVYNGTATSARWADLAERYKADAIYPAGTVLAVALDGDAEVTLYQAGMPLAGAISTDPAVMMNDMGIAPSDRGRAHKMNPYVALKGRIPVLINGTAKKGQWVVADKDGRGRAVDYGTVGINTLEVIGIAIGDCDGNGEVEVKV